MADTKISAATAVVTPASTDEYPTNQGGASKKTTRAQIHALESGERLLPDAGTVAAPGIAFNTDQNTGFYSTGADAIGVATGGGQRFLINASYMVQCPFTNGPGIRYVTSSPTVPGINPSRADTDTGLGWHSADNVSLVAGGLEAIRAEDPADLAAGETSLWLYDDDNGAIQQVTVGAADSGGSGFKVLRIPN